jgi:hypothetical protein
MWAAERHAGGVEEVAVSVRIRIGCLPDAHHWPRVPSGRASCAFPVLTGKHHGGRCGLARHGQRRPSRLRASRYRRLFFSFRSSLRFLSLT